MSGAKKSKYETPKTGGEGNVGHGGISGGVGEHVGNQVLPGHQAVPRCPEDEGSYDENFGHKHNG